MGETLSGALMTTGVFFMLLAAVGVARLPDLFMRMHASTKSVTLGVGCLMLGVAVYFNDLAISARALAVVVFVFATAPVASHMIARAAYFANVPLWEGTLSDELDGRYEAATHVLHSHGREEEWKDEAGRLKDDG